MCSDDAKVRVPGHCEQSFLQLNLFKIEVAFGSRNTQKSERNKIGYQSVLYTKHPIRLTRHIMGTLLAHGKPP